MRINILLICIITLLFVSCEYEEVDLEGKIETIEVIDIQTTSATVKGNLSFVSKKIPYTYTSSHETGVCYSTTSHPTVKDRKVIGKRINQSGKITITVTNPEEGMFTANLIGLQKNTTYYVRSYLINETGIFYGNNLFFNTLSTTNHPPEVSTLPATDITENTVTLNGKIDNEGDPQYTERGFIYSNIFKKPTIEDVGEIIKKHIVPGISIDFQANITGLATGTTYYARAYATSNNNTVSFKAENPNYYILTSKKIMVQKQDIGSGSWDNTFSWISAKQKIAQSRVAGYTDWRLPTIEELEIIYEKQVAIGGFEISSYFNFYWSSTPHQDSYLYDNFYWGINFMDGTHEDKDEMSYSYGRARAVRTLP